MAKTEYTAKVDALLEHATALGFTEEDFADLALAAADQAGLSGNEQHTIAGLLGVTSYAMRPPVASHAASCGCADCPLNRCTECSRPVDGYEPTARDAKLAAKALSASSTAVRVPECTLASHDAIKRNPAAWSRLKLIGFQPTYAEFPEPNALEMRNCTCGSTLCLPVLKRMHLGKIVDESTSEAA